MAESPQRVIEFLRELARRSRPAAVEEIETLTRYAGRKLEPWDVGFYAERLKQERLKLAVRRRHQAVGVALQHGLV